jgi:hypothetical protein
VDNFNPVTKELAPLNCINDIDQSPLQDLSIAENSVVPSYERHDKRGAA